MSSARDTMDEIELEARFSRKRIIIVEGESDRIAYSLWIARNNIYPKVDIIPIDRVEIDNSDVAALNLPHESNRSRVIAAAKHFESNPPFIRYIADRDTGQNVSCFQLPHLWWTDFPALESLLVREETIVGFAISTLRTDKGTGQKIFRDLTRALAMLYSIRASRPHMEAPNYRKGLAKAESLSDYNAVDACGLRAAQVDPSGLAPLDSGAIDVRSQSYGHDVCSLLMAAFPAKIKTRNGFHKVEQLELSLLREVIPQITPEDAPLFGKLDRWLLAEISFNH